MQGNRPLFYANLLVEPCRSLVYTRCGPWGPLYRGETFLKKNGFPTFEAENWVLGFVQICNKNGGVNNTGPAYRPGSKMSRHDPSMPRANLIPFPARVPRCNLYTLTDHDSKMGYRFPRINCLVSTLMKMAESFRV
jgi:hypothetical protein